MQSGDWCRRAPESGPSRTARLAAATGIVGLGVWGLSHWQPRPMAVDDQQARVIFYREGVTATVQVNEDRHNPRHREMYVDAIKIGQSEGGVDRKQQCSRISHLCFVQNPPPAVFCPLVSAPGS